MGRKERRARKSLTPKTMATTKERETVFFLHRFFALALSYLSSGKGS